MYEVKQLYCLNDSQRGFIVSTDGRKLLYVRQCRVYAELCELRLHITFRTDQPQ